MLKQQGLWSNLKGCFGIGHEAREKERVAAKNFINNTLMYDQMPTKAYSDEKFDNQISLKQAKKYQLSMMNTSSISPTMTKGLEPVGLGPLQKAKKSEEFRMSMLARDSYVPKDDQQSIGKLLLDEQQSIGNLSYKHIEPDEEVEKNVIEKVEIKPRQNSYMPAPSEAHESDRILGADNGLSQFEEVEDDQSQDSFIVKNRNSDGIQQFNNFIVGMLLKDHNTSAFEY